MCDVLCQAHLYEADVKISRSLVEVFQSLARINHATSDANSPSHSESASLFTVNISIYCNIDVFNIGCVYIVRVYTPGSSLFVSSLFVCWIFASFPTGELKRPSNWKKHAFRLSRITWRTSALRKTGPVFVEIWWYATSWQHRYGWLQPIV